MTGAPFSSSRARIQAALGGLAFAASLTGVAMAQQQNATLTAVSGIKVGHHTLTERPTGCTVILAEQGVIAGVDVRGSAPGTRETDLLRPVNLVDKVNAIVLTGGSAFGLDSASGVMRFLDEKGMGFQTEYGPVPIVPAAVIFDLGVGDPKVRPGPDCGYAAAKAAMAVPVQEGNVGAGAGATVGKAGGAGRAMRGGLGSAAIRTPDGLVVAALIVVNAFGDVIDPATDRVMAGVRTDDGRALADVRRLLRAGAGPDRPFGRNTTIGVVATNATLSKTEATKIAEMAHDGIARAVAPAHTMFDGDALFALATGEREGPANVSAIGALAADAVTQAIVRAVRAATGLPGLPAARDLQPPSRE